MKPNFKISFTIPEEEDRLRGFLNDNGKSSICAYAEVDKHQEIAKVEIHRGDGEDGEDGDIQLPHFFNTNDLVSRIEKDMNTFIYLAKEKGLCRFSPSELKVLEDGIIAEDIGPATGNINVKNMNLIIRGQVLNGYKVNCGGNLHIVKSVEDNVNIVCNGNLDVDWGITGKNTEVQCSKNLNAGFVEKSTVICDGDMEIKGNLFQATIYCRGSLRVKGAGKSTKRAAVVGGLINCLNGMVLKSVGSESCPTDLITSIDLRLQEQLQDANTLFNTLKNKILVYQKEVETYIAAINKAKSLGNMSRKAKELVRNKLYKLQQKQNVIGELNEKIKILKRKALPANKNVTMTIEDFIDPIVTIKFDSTELVIKERAPGRRVFKLVNGYIKNLV